jgi:putative PEP-CTERM system histidine kinase
MSVISIMLLTGAVWALGLAVTAAVKSARSPARWAFALGMLLFAIESFFLHLSLAAESEERVTRWQAFRLLTSAFLPAAWLFFAVCFARGNHALYLRKWRGVLLVACALPVIPLAAFGDLARIAVDSLRPGEGAVFVLSGPAKFLSGLLVACAVLILMNLERTFRAAVGIMRWRIKFIVLGLGLLFAVRIYTSSQVLLYSATNPGLESFNAAALVLACLLLTVSAFRAGLFNADIYPSPTIIYHSLTVLLAGVYLVIVGLLANVVVRLGGDPAFPFEAFFILISLVVLGVILTSERVRLIIKRFVSRHFRRPFYDYRRIWRDFAERTASRMDDAGLCQQAVRLVSETLGVLSVTLWLAEEQEGRISFGASTSVADEQALELLPSSANVSRFLDQMRHRSEPVNIDTAKEDWAEELRRSNPHRFVNHGGNRWCVALVAKGQVIGLLMVGDRVSGVPYSLEDLELLKCIAHQVAGSLLNLRLARGLLEAKELEAFQNMAAFCVHDLKNTASSLTLLLRNLPAQFENPEFRQDALRAVSQGVNRLNELIGRFSLLRQGAQMNRTNTDLNSVVESALDQLGPADEPALTRHLEPVPKASLDPDQIQKVVLNLVLNAREAVNGHGEIDVSTSRQGDAVVLSIRDNGCGMSPEFIRRSLFRPFQTTKKSGMGIGLFHCRMIVEAHGGRIEVESQEGKGTQFRVVLPLPRHSP